MATKKNKWINSFLKGLIDKTKAPAKRIKKIFKDRELYESGLDRIVTGKHGKLSSSPSAVELILKEEKKLNKKEVIADEKARRARIQAKKEEVWKKKPWLKPTKRNNWGRKWMEEYGKELGKIPSTFHRWYF